MAEKKSRKPHKTFGERLAEYDERIRVAAQRHSDAIALKTAFIDARRKKAAALVSEPPAA